ncbi:hypothetical protein [Phormidium sp. CCY1219]|uniref:hypothetical protein n=1 Tax=Phormidium sp. CCY1219 TaxID=2886104 RepID=UPI002D1F1282|nr:hypothetical protein [Phormidium sp. CCY1219]MEB3827713.1 hypothetical protein [Phormidium sp. CCY1219]
MRTGNQLHRIHSPKRDRLEQIGFSNECNPLPGNWKPGILSAIPQFRLALKVALG